MVTPDQLRRIQEASDEWDRRKVAGISFDTSIYPDGNLYWADDDDLMAAIRAILDEDDQSAF